MQLIFATTNANKVLEVRSLLPSYYTISSLSDIGYNKELPETSDTIEGNSRQKAEVLSAELGLSCFAEDTGLIIDGLEGRPGVYSARYAGSDARYEDNVAKVLNEMIGIANRRARFKTVITYYNAGKSVQFTGICEGQIIDKPKGESGFGYDPIFIPEGCNQTFAEMRLIDKNQYSHRKKALEKFILYLKQKE